MQIYQKEVSLYLLKYNVYKHLPKQNVSLYQNQIPCYISPNKIPNYMSPNETFSETLYVRPCISFYSL